MKLHLPCKLLATVLASLGSFSFVGTTLSTASLAGSLFLVSMVGQVHAVEYKTSGTYTDDDFSNNACFVADASDTEIIINISGAKSAAALAGSTSAENGGTITKKGVGTLTVTDLYSNNGHYTLNIEQGTLQIDEQKNGTAFNRGTINVKSETDTAASTLFLNGNDMLGWGSTGVHTINLQGSAGSGTGNLATMKNNDRITLETAVNLKGHTRIESEGSGTNGYDLYGTTISASGSDNIISAVLYERTASTISIEENGYLTLSGGITQRSYESGYITKAGAGTLTITGGLNLKGALNITGGTVELGGLTKMENAITNSGTVTIKDGFMYMGDLSKGAYDTDGNYTTYTVATSSIASGGTVNTNSTVWSIDGDNLAFKSYHVTHSETGEWTWNRSTIVQNGEADTTWVNGETITFNGAGESLATLGEDIYAMGISVADGTTLSLSGNGHKLITHDVTVDGSLSFDNLTPDIKGTISGSGSLNLGLGQETYDSPVDWTSKLSDFTGDLVISSGYFKNTVSEALDNKRSITIEGSGMLWMHGANHHLYNDITIQNVTNRPDNNAAPNSLNVDGAIIGKEDGSNTITIIGNATIHSQWSGTLNSAITGDGKTSLTLSAINEDFTINSSISGVQDITIGGSTAGSVKLTNSAELGHSGTLKIAGGNLKLGGDFTYSRDITITSGQLTLGTGQSDSSSINLTKVDLQGGRLYIDHSVSGINISEIKLATDAEIYVFDTNVDYSNGNVTSTDEMTLTKLNLSGNAKLTYEWKAALDISTLTGDGDLAISSKDYAQGLKTVISGIENYSGTISTLKLNEEGEEVSAVHNHKLYLGSVTQAAEEEAIVKGATLSTDFTKTGAGSIALDSHTATGSMMVNEGSFSVNTLTIGTETTSGSVHFEQKNTGNTVVTVSGTTLNIVNGSAWFGKGVDNDSGAGNDADKATIQFSTVNIGANGTLSISHWDHEFKNANNEWTNINLNGGKIYAQDMRQGTDDDEGGAKGAASFGILTLGASGSTLEYKWNGELIFQKLTGTGNLEINKGAQGVSENHKTQFNAITDYTGNITYTADKAGVHTLYIGTVTQTNAAHVASIEGTSKSTNFSMSGSGSLTLDSHEAEGSFSVNGGKVTVDTLTVAQALTVNGGTLSITDGGSVSTSNADGIAIRGGVLELNGSATVGSTVNVQKAGDNSSYTTVACVSGSGTTNATYSNIKVEQSGISRATEGSVASISNAAIALSSNYTISNVALSDIAFTATEGAGFTATGTTLAGTNTLTLIGDTIAMTGATITIDVLSDMELSGSLELGFTDSLIASVYNKLNVGDSLTISLGLSIPQVPAEIATYAETTPDVTVSEAMATRFGHYDVVSTDTGVNIIFAAKTAAAIPEPATATLSLLALAALAARRRRK